MDIHDRNIFEAYAKHRSAILEEKSCGSYKEEKEEELDEECEDCGFGNCGNCDEQEEGSCGQEEEIEEMDDLGLDDEMPEVEESGYESLDPDAHRMAPTPVASHFPEELGYNPTSVSFNRDLFNSTAVPPEEKLETLSELYAELLNKVSEIPDEKIKIHDRIQNDIKFLKSKRAQLGSEIEEMYGEAFAYNCMMKSLRIIRESVGISAALQLIL